MDKDLEMKKEVDKLWEAVALNQQLDTSFLLKQANQDLMMQHMQEQQDKWLQDASDKLMLVVDNLNPNKQPVFDKLGVSWSCPHVVTWRDVESPTPGSYLAHGNDPNHEIFFSRLSLVKMTKRERSGAIRGWLEQCCGKDPQLPLSLLPVD